MANKIYLLKSGNFYKQVVYTQVCIFFAALVMPNLLGFLNVNENFSIIIRDGVFFIFAGFYVYWTIKLIYNLSNNKSISYSMIGLFLLSVILAFLTANPLFDILKTDEVKQPWYFSIHLTLFIYQSYLIYISIYDLFNGDRISNEKLWGMACIYIMIGFAFGSLYDIINIVKPGSLGVDVAMGLESFYAAIFYSLNMIGGHDAFENAHPLVHNIGIIETVWSNIFIVVLVGRVLTKPGD